MSRLDKLVVGLFFGFLIGMITGTILEKSFWKDAIIKRHMGQYCPFDGEFAFEGECKGRK